MNERVSRIDETERLIKRQSLVALAVGAVPLPWLDLAVLASLQLDLVRRLAERYGVAFSDQADKSAVAALLGGTFPVSVSINLASLVKGMPIVGSVLGGASVAVIGAASTYAIGRVFVQHFESGGTMLTFDPEKVRAYYAEQTARGEVEVLKSYVGIKP